MLETKYSAETEGKHIWVFDDQCTHAESSELYNSLIVSAFKRDEIARPDTKDYRHLAVNLNSMFFKSLPVYQRCLQVIEKVTGKRYQAYRSYVNYTSFGDMLFSHTDCLPESDELTVLVYICEEWNIEWLYQTCWSTTKPDLLSSALHTGI